jgi:hypothetical protein
MELDTIMESLSKLLRMDTNEKYQTIGYQVETHGKLKDPKLLILLDSMDIQNILMMKGVQELNGEVEI